MQDRYVSGRFLLSGPDAVASALDWSNRGPLHLDLSDEALSGGDSPSGVRLNSASVLVLANLLLQVDCEDLSFSLPVNRGLVMQLTRGGFFFAMARCSVLDEPEARNWIESFDPNSSAERQLALGWPDISKDDFFATSAVQRYLYSFVNPHKRPAQDVHSEVFWTLLQPWLNRRLSLTAKNALGTKKLIKDAGRVTVELIDNVAEHAELGESGVSLSQVWATLGGGSQSFNRLHFSAMDTGIGIGESLAGQGFGHDFESLVLHAVSGELPIRETGRTYGYRNITKIARRLRDQDGHGPSEITVLTNHPGQSGNALEIAFSSAADSFSSKVIEGLPIRGTIVLISLGLGTRVELKDETDQLELTFSEAL